MANELPSKQEEIVWCPLSGVQKFLYKKVGAGSTPPSRGRSPHQQMLLRQTAPSFASASFVSFVPSFFCLSLFTSPSRSSDSPLAGCLSVSHDTRELCLPERKKEGGNRERGRMKQEKKLQQKDRALRVSGLVCPFTPHRKKRQRERKISGCVCCVSVCCGLGSFVGEVELSEVRQTGRECKEVLLLLLVVICVFRRLEIEMPDVFLSSCGQGSRVVVFLKEDLLSRFSPEGEKPQELKCEEEGEERDASYQPSSCSVVTVLACMYTWTPSDQIEENPVGQNRMVQLRKICNHPYLFCFNSFTRKISSSLFFLLLFLLLSMTTFFFCLSVPSLSVPLSNSVSLSADVFLKKAGRAGPTACCGLRDRAT